MNDTHCDLLCQAWQFYGNGFEDKSLVLCDQLLKAHPKHAEVMHLKALLLWGQGDHDSAISLLEQASQIQPENPQHFNNLGVFLNKKGLYDQAERSLQKALAIDPRYPDARCNLGLCWFHQNKLQPAAQCFKETIDACPTHGPAHANLGMTLLAQGATIKAAKAYERALSICPEQASWWDNLGAAYLADDDFNQAVRAFKQTVALNPENADYHNHLGVALRGLGDFAGSIKILQQALSLAPDHPEALSNLCVALQQTCQWRLLNPLLQRLDNQTRSALERNNCPAEQPMFNIWRSTNLSLNHAVACAWSHEARQKALRSAPAFTYPNPITAERPIHLGYLSYDFRNHPVSHQLLPLFGLHDRERFKVTAFSMGPDDHSEFRSRIQRDCDQFIEIGHLSPQQAAQQIHHSGVDILIDLMGHSHHNRMQILAMRPAPIQVGYLGFLATTGADYMDYLIADETVVPPKQTEYYSEKLIYMPHCYQMNHNLFFPEALVGTKETYGLPTDAIVFSSFNNAYKINDELLDAWTAILKQVPQSVLWLYKDNAVAMQQLTTLSRQKGLEHGRIIFADKVPLQSHIQRLQHADLALDTDDYNGGATTANALWAGLPVLTVMGRHWVSRMSASHLKAASLSELITSDLQAYVNKAVDLATHPEKLHNLSSALKQQRLTAPLFDAKVFARDLETGLQMIWERYCTGMAPDHIRIPPSKASAVHKQENNVSDNACDSSQNVNLRPYQIKGCQPTGDAFAGIEKELSAEGLFRLALWFQSNHDIEKAVETYGLVLNSAPDMVEAHYNLGVLRYEQQMWPEAITHFKKAVQIKPAFMDAFFNLASAYKENGCPSEAAQMYHKVLKHNPKSVQAHYYRAICLQNMGNHSAAISGFKKALTLDQDNALIWFHLATSLIKTHAMDQVLNCYQNAVALKPDWDRAHFNLAIALRLKERIPEAITHMQKVIEINPDFNDAHAYLFRLAQHACEWKLMQKAEAQLERLTAKQLANGEKTSEFPLISLRRQAHPPRNLAVARSWSQDITRELSTLQERPAFKYPPHAPAKLRIGYLSSDFKDHAVAHQIRGMLAAHNRQAFEVIAYVANPDDGTRYRQLLCQACDKTRDIVDLSPVEAARQIHSDSIQILVEMSGHSRDSLLPIAALRPAPVQVGYLGYLGSTGADFIDYVIADAVAVPPDHADHYTEKMVYMPHCYQANDDRQIISEKTYSRQDFNLPAKGFVYCCFNQPYKIDPQLFEVWMDILKQVDGSVLWLIERSPLATQNLIAAARKRGVDPDRLVFTGFIPLEDNLARLRLADLALDTWIYNGGATTANALWACVPVITLLGHHWVSRMTASALHAIHMPELIAPDKQSYADLAIHLATTPGAITSLKNKLAKQRMSAPLFDTTLFTRHLEKAYRTMWNHFKDGQPPAPFKVTP